MSSCWRMPRKGEIPIETRAARVLGSSSGNPFTRWRRHWKCWGLRSGQLLSFRRRTSVRPEDFLQAVEEDAKKARGLIRLVMAQPDVSSMLIDNVNASIHLRALLTDLFVIDEAFKT